MSRYSKITWLLMAFLLVSLAACGGGSKATPTTDPAMVYTQAWETAVAGLTLTAQVAPPSTATNTVASVVDTPVPQATHTPLVPSGNTPVPGAPTATKFTVGTPKATEVQTCNNMQFVADVTYPDGAIVSPGEKIDKTWTVKNLGPCTWTPQYRIVFGWGADGTNWYPFLPINLGQTVNPGESVDITVYLDAPSTPGDYFAVFRLQTDQWVTLDNLANFGAFSIKITVE